MKKLFYLLLLAVMPLFFASCSDDDDSVIIDSPIVGTWYVNNYYLGIKSEITFHSNGKVESKETWNNQTYTDKGSYRVEDEKETDSGIVGTVYISWPEEEVICAYIIYDDGEKLTWTMYGEEGYTTWKRK